MVFAIVLTALAAMLPAAAQSYPARAIRMIIPWPPGGGSSEKFATFIGTETARWVKLIKAAAGIKAE